MAPLKKTKAACALALLVAAAHLGYDPMAAWIYPDARVAAGKAIFYILRGIETCILWCVVLRSYKPASPILVVACVWGAIESGQEAICRMALPIGGKAPVAPNFGGICDLVAGLPVSGVVAVLVLIAISVVQEIRDGRTQGG